MAVSAEIIGLDRADNVDLDRDRQLVVRYQGGDQGAFDELYRRYFDRLHGYCQRRVGDRHAAEELAQEAFVRALRAMPRFAGERRFYPWMTVIAQRLCIDHHRRVARVEPTAEVDLGTVEADHDALFDAVDHGYLATAIQRLAPRHREVLELRERRNWSYQQIAEHLDVPVTTVEALLHRARKALKREFLAVTGDTNGRLAGLPLLGAVMGLAARVRLRFGRMVEQAGGLGQALAPAAAGVAAVGLVLVPLAGSDNRGPTTVAPTTVTTGASSAVVASAPALPAADAFVVTVAPTAVTSGATGSVASPEPAADLAVVEVYQGSDDIEALQAEEAEQPVYVDLGVAQVSLNPAQTVEDLLEPGLGGNP